MSEVVQKSADSCFCGISFCMSLRIAISLNCLRSDFTKNTYPQKYSYIILRFISQLLYNDVDSRLSVMHESLHRPYQPDSLKSIHITKRRR